MPSYKSGKLIWNKSELGLIARHFAFEIYKKKYKCEKCDSQSRLEVHHKDMDITNNTEDNLRVLCKHHHNEIHGRMIPTKVLDPLSVGDAIQLYIIERKPVSYIMEKYGCSRHSVLKIFKEGNIEKRKSKRAKKILDTLK